MHTPGFYASLGNDNASTFCHGHKVLKNEGITPGERLRRVADRAIFVTVRVFHQDRADAIWPQLRTKRPIALPETFVIVTNLWTIIIDVAPMPYVAMFAKLTGGLHGFFNLEHLATEAAFRAGFSGNCHHFIRPKKRR
jgi:hypothetical protein